MIAVAALLLALAVFTIIPASPEPRLDRLVSSAVKPRERLTPRQLRYGASVILAVCALMVLGMKLGVPLAILVLVVVPRMMSRLESGETRRYREALDRQLPDALDALASLLESGALPEQALQAVGQAWGGPMEIELTRVSRSVGLGASAEQAWGPAHASLQPLAASLVRSADSGAPLAAVIAGAAVDARRDRRLRVEVAARSAGVKAVAPLAACFLPAFFLMGVAPIIASFVEQVLDA